MAGVRQEGILQVDDVGGGAGANVSIVDPIGPNLAAASVSVTLATDESPIDVILPDVTVVGTITAMSQSVGVDTNGYATATFQITGTWDDELRLEATVNGIDFEIVIGRLLDLTIYSNISNNITANNVYVVACSGYSHVRLKSYAYVSGTVEITAIANATASTQPYAAHQGIPGNPLTPWYTTRPDLRFVGTLENPNDVAVMALGGVNHGNYGTVTYHISGTWIATIEFSGTGDESNYEIVPVYDLATGALVPNSQITVNGFYLIASAGFSFIRAEAIAYTSGTVQVTGIASAPINPLTFPKDVTLASAIDANIVSPLGANVAANSVSVTLATDEAPLQVEGTQASGEPSTTNPIAIAGRYDATPPTLLDGDVVAFQASSRGSMRVTAGEEGLFIQGISDVVQVNSIESEATDPNSDKVFALGGQYKTIPPTYLDNQVTRVQTDNRGAIHVTAVDLDIRNLVFATDKVDASGSTISGTKSNDAVAPGATNLGVLPAIARAGVPLYTNGNQVALNTDLSGNLRTTVDSISNIVTVQGTDEDGNATTGDYLVPIGAEYNDPQPTLVNGSASRLQVNDRAALIVVQGVDGFQVNTKRDLTPQSPTVASVGLVSASVVVDEILRTGLTLRNLSNARISLGFGAAAVLDSGVTLYPRDVFQMGEYDFDKGAVNAIASAAASPLAIQQYTY